MIITHADGEVQRGLLPRLMAALRAEGARTRGRTSEAPPHAAAASRRVRLTPPPRPPPPRAGLVTDDLVGGHDKTDGGGAEAEAHHHDSWMGVVRLPRQGALHRRLDIKARARPFVLTAHAPPLT